MPTPTRVAVILLGLIAVLLLATSLLIWLDRERFIGTLVEGGASRDDAARSAVLLLLGYGALGLTAAVSSVFLARRRAWARLTSLLVFSFLTAGMLLIVLFSGAVTAQGLLILVASVAGLTSVASGQTREWLRESPTA